jgi:HK97 family phage portal protein
MAALVPRVIGSMWTALRGTLSARPTRPGGWMPLAVREPYSGAWQQDIETPLAEVVTNPTVYACVSLIASDIGKMRVKLTAEQSSGIWRELRSPAFSPVLEKPNRYQTRILFFQQWVTSKLYWGNTYVLKGRDQRGVVNRLGILHPGCVVPLIAPDGEVYYQLSRDPLAGVAEDLTPERAIPAREIIHDVMVPLYHPLVGVSPIAACGLAAMQGLRMQTSSAHLFANGCRPSGVLTAPGAIDQPTADRIKAYWQEAFTGANIGRLAVVGDGLKYEPLGMNPVDAAIIDQLKWTDEAICRCFHVPRYKVEVGPDPTFSNINALDTQYYAQCLQILIESIELLLDEGLELPTDYGTEFDLDALIRMDSPTMIEAEKTAIGAGIKAPNESRQRLNLPPVEGGETPYLQQQNYSLAALARRDAQGLVPPTPPAPAAADDTDADGDDEAFTAAFAAALHTHAQTEGLYAA